MDPEPVPGGAAPRPGQVDDDQLTGEVADWMVDEGEEVPLRRDPDVLEPGRLLRLGQGLSDRVFERGTAGQSLDDGQLSGRTPVG